MTKDNLVIETKDYKQFKLLPGNRPVDPGHVQELVRALTEKGNLTNHFPLVVNEKMEVIDGQHRLKALEELGWSFCYRVQEGLTIETVRNINSAQKNWSWKDYANSYTALGNDNYKRFLELYKEYNQGFHVLALYAGINRDKQEKNSLKYMSGELVFTPEDKERASSRLAMAGEIITILAEKQTEIRVNNNLILRALYTIMQSPNYDHDRMVHKATNYGSRIKIYGLAKDQLRALEDLYNFNMKDGSEPVRLF